VRGKTETLPLTPGTGKSALRANYVNRLPVNMLFVPPKVVNQSGYMRSFPGLVKTAGVAGLSRGVLLNAFDGRVYRLCGNTLYQSGTAVSTHANARYAWLKKGTNTFGVTDINDESKPDRYRPFMTASALPDPAVGIAASLDGQYWSA